MPCPFCGSELEEGSLVLGKGVRLLWMPNRKLPQGFVNYLSFFKTCLHGDARIQAEYEAICLQEDTEPDLYVSHYSLSICRHCKKGILNISNVDPTQPT